MAGFLNHPPAILSLTYTSPIDDTVSGVFSNAPSTPPVAEQLEQRESTSRAAFASNPLRSRKRYQAERLLRRNRRLAIHFEHCCSVAQMEHSKYGVMRIVDFKRVVRSRTTDSSSTCVSDCPSYESFDPAGTGSDSASVLTADKPSRSLEDGDESFPSGTLAAVEAPAVVEGCVPA